tara:strand:- start:7177 stop:7587 length:411 start_codon:yes stop_codon:yes gene_type:complete
MNLSNGWSIEYEMKDKEILRNKYGEREEVLMKYGSMNLKVYDPTNSEYQPLCQEDVFPHDISDIIALVNKYDEEDIPHANLVDYVQAHDLDSLVVSSQDSKTLLSVIKSNDELEQIRKNHEPQLTQADLQGGNDNG